jgi:Putative serine esterase (DUF676)
MKRFFSKLAFLSTLLFLGLAASAQAQTPAAVIFIHGFDPNYRNEDTYRSHDCTSANNFKNTLSYYRARTNVPLVTFGLYAKSQNCNFYAYNPTFMQPGATRDAHYNRNVNETFRTDPYIFSNDKSIRQLGYRLAWFIYNNYSKNGKTVSIVGHSMGGLVARYAVGQTSRNHPDFPPYLYVKGLAMLGTPNGGSVWGNACTLTAPIAQCTEMSVGSQFLNDLNNNIDWGNSGIVRRLSMNRGQGTTAGYDGVAYDYNDMVATQVRYYNPTYGHGDYQNDTSDLLNANITYNLVSRNSSGTLLRSTGTSTAAEHSVRMMYKYTVE